MENQEVKAARETYEAAIIERIQAEDKTNATEKFFNEVAKRYEKDRIRLQRAQSFEANASKEYFDALEKEARKEKSFTVEAGWHFDKEAFNRIEVPTKEAFDSIYKDETRTEGKTRFPNIEKGQI